MRAARPALFVSILALAASAYAQEAPPALLVKEGERSVPLPLARADVDVRIVGGAGECRMTLVFRNDADRPTEGDLYFPLPEGSTVSGYALDVNGTMVDGVVVKKEEAQVIFEQEVRKGVDPGLVEWSKGNSFKTRIFPIPPKGTRTAMVRYVADLSWKDGTAAFHLPLAFRDPVPEARIRIEVVDPPSEPKLAGAVPAGLSFRKADEGWIAETTIREAKIQGSVSVEIPDAAKEAPAVEKDENGDFYFSIQDFPEAPPVKAGERAGAVRIGLLWDASGSREKQDRERELKLLEGVLKRVDRAIVSLFVFRNVLEKDEAFEINKGDAARLVERLKSLPYDGGTRFALPMAAEKGAGAPTDFYLLFSDGLGSFGDEEPAGLDAPLYAVSSAASANHPFLRYLALKTGGAYVNLNRVGEAEALAAIGAPVFSFLSAEYDPKEIAEAYPGVATPVQGPFALAGRLVADKARITLRYGIGGKVLSSKTFEVSKNTAPGTGVVPISFAQRKLADLMVFPDRNRDAMVALGRKFGLVTPGTSLLVLESLDQYLEHRVAPPKSLPAMREEWEKRIDEQAQQVAKGREEKLQQVLEMWRGRVEWWGKEFKYPPDLKVASADTKGENGAMGEAVRADSAEPSNAVPGAPPPEAPSATPDPAAAPLAEGPAGGAERDFGQRPARRAGWRHGDAAKEAKDGEDGASPPSLEIQLAAWDPKTPYIEAMKEAGPEDAYAAYLKQREKHGTSPAFYFDSADYLFKNGKKPEALRVLTNVAEMELSNPALLRILAYRLKEAGELEAASRLLDEVLKLRPEEPQSYRDLALVLAETKQYERALDLLWEVVTRTWDGRFPEIELVALMEMNRIVPLARAAGVARIPLDSRIEKLLDLDVRIALHWDADQTDLDLWVTEPSGEKCFYGHPDTVIGGHISKDYTQGYGPEEYLLRKVMPGEYLIQANYYGSRLQELAGPATLQVTIYTNWGRPNEERKTITVRLQGVKDVVEIGKIKL